MTDDATAFWRRMGDAELPHPRPAGLMTALRAVLPPWSAVGWLTACFGMAFVCISGVVQSLEETVVFRRELAEEPAVVTAVEMTKVTINDERVRRVRAVVDRGKGVDVVSYQTGAGLQVDDVVTVEFPAGDLAGGRIKGLRRSPSPVWTAFVFVFPAIGLGVVAYLVRQSLRQHRLLRRGRIAIAELGACRATSVEVNDQRVYEYPYAFAAADGSAAAGRHRTHKTRGLPAGGGRLPVLYLPESPAKSMLVQNPSKAPPGYTIDDAGTLHAAAGGVTVSLLICLPLIVLFAAEVWAAVTGAWVLG